MKPILCVVHQASLDLGIGAAALIELGVPYRYLHVWRGDEVPNMDSIAGAVFLGGSMNVDDIERYSFLSTSRALVEEAIGRDLPILGICLGAQLLARALGAEVGTAARREIGFHRVWATQEAHLDPLLGTLAPTNLFFQWHKDAFELPRGAELLYEGSGTRNQAFRFGRSTYGVQFHLEVTRDTIAKWCTNTPKDELEGVWGISKHELEEQADRYLDTQQRLARRVWRDFARIVQSKQPGPDILD